MNETNYVVINKESHEGKLVKLNEEEVKIARKIFNLHELPFIVKIPNEVRFCNWLRINGYKIINENNEVVDANPLVNEYMDHISYWGTNE